MGLSIKNVRQHAMSIFQNGIDAADPYLAVKNCLTVAENHFEIALDINDKSKKLCGRWSKIHIIAFGKAACNMTKAVNELIPEHRLAGIPIAVTNYENAQASTGFEVIPAGHPSPDNAGLKAAQKLTEKLKNTEINELVLVLISGGGSALIPYPAFGITLKDKQITTNLLLASGASIQQINCVRKHTSQLKGGNLAKLAAPADLHTFTLSDVVGDDLSTIASGPTFPDDSTFSEAINILKEKGIWKKTPINVQTLLEKGVQGQIKETPKSGQSFFTKNTYTLVGSNTISLESIIKTADKLGYDTDVYSQSVSGEARDFATQLAGYAKTRIESGLSNPTAILSGGETTVSLKGTGKGGRNQETALAFAIAAKKHKLKGKWVFLSGGTDGCDGPTDAAGGMVDSGTLARMKKARANPKNRLNNNDSYSALKKSEDLVITGPTGTNVADFQILLIQPE